MTCGFHYTNKKIYIETEYVDSIRKYLNNPTIINGNGPLRMNNFYNVNMIYLERKPLIQGLLNSSMRIDQ